MTETAIQAHATASDPAPAAASTGLVSVPEPRLLVVRLGTPVG